MGHEPSVDGPISGGAPDQGDKSAETQSRMETAPTQRTEPQEVRIVGMPPLWKMIASLGTTAFVIIGSLATFGSLYLAKSLETTESKIIATLGDKLDPVNQRLADLRAVATLLVSKTKLTDEEREGFNKLLSKVEPTDLKRLTSNKQNYDRKSLKALIDSHQVKEVGRISDLKWHGDRPAQVRYIEVLNPDLDLSQVEFYSDGENGCRSEMLDDTGTFGSATVQVCTTHMDSDGRLELVIVTNAHNSNAALLRQQEIARNRMSK